jgi:hypothetical protein
MGSELPPWNYGLKQSLCIRQSGSGGDGGDISSLVGRLDPATGRIAGTAAFGIDLPHVGCGLVSALHATARFGTAVLQAGRRRTDTAGDQHDGHKCRYYGSKRIGHYHVPSNNSFPNLSAFLN